MVGDTEFAYSVDMVVDDANWLFFATELHTKSAVEGEEVASYGEVKMIDPLELKKYIQDCNSLE